MHLTSQFSLRIVLPSIRRQALPTPQRVFLQMPYPLIHGQLLPEVLGTIPQGESSLQRPWPSAGGLVPAPGGESAVLSVGAPSLLSITVLGLPHST